MACKSIFESISDLAPEGSPTQLNQSEPPKILFYYPDFGAFGGIERFILSVSLYLKDERQFQPFVICSKNTPFYYRLQQAGIHVYGIRTLPCFSKPLLRMLDLPSMIQIQYYLRQIRPDLIHIHIGQIENLLFKLLGYPLVYTFHGYGSLYNLDTKAPIVKQWIKKALCPLFTGLIPHLDRLLFVSQSEQSRMIRQGYLSAENHGEVLHNGFPILEFSERAKRTQRTAMLQTLGIPESARCISFISRLDWNKNPLRFLQLAERLGMIHHMTQPLHFIIAGDGPLAPVVKKRIAKSPIRNQIHYLGPRSDVAELLACSDLTLHLPSAEGFGFGVLESMATGTLCLAHAVGGIPELLDIPEAEPLLAPVEDFEVLVNKAVTLLNLSVKERSSLCQRLQKRAFEFDLSTMMERLENIYTQTICQSRKVQNQPLVSVILPVYQGEALVLRAVQSVLNQTYPNLELLVVDDGSTDGTFERLQRIQDSRLKVFTQENQGVAAARNLGISQAQGEYLAFLDADDLWFPQKLETELATVTQHRDPVCLVYSGYYAVDESDGLVNLSPLHHGKGKLFKAVFEKEGLLLPSTTLMHRQVAETVGGFPTQSYHEDRVFFICACRMFPAYPTKQRLVIYRQTLSGRCRSVLSDYDSALKAELSIVDALHPMLSPSEAKALTMIQTRNLLYRFLMYDFIASAQALRQKMAPILPLRDKKGLLARISLSFGFNALYACRVAVQFSTRYVLLPWWRWKSASAYTHVQKGSC